MGIHIGSLVRKVMDEKRVKSGELAKRLGMHLGSMSRIMKYEEINTAQLKKLCVALGYDFFSDYSEELKLRARKRRRRWMPAAKNCWRRARVNWRF